MIKIFLAFLLFGTLQLSAQYSQQYPSIILPGNPEEKHELCSHAQHLLSKINSEKILVQTPSSIDIVSYNIFMDWLKPFSTVDTVLPTYTFSGKNTIRFIPVTLKGSKIQLNAESMRIDSVRHNGTLIANTSITAPANGSWSYDAGNSLKQDTNTVEIWYTYTGDGKKGFNYYPKGMFVRKYQGLEDNYVEEDLAYVMSQPEDARYWMPCNDRPDDKAQATMSIRVPYNPNDSINIIVTSNGDLISLNVEQSTTPSYRDFTFSDTTQIPTYLMVANASRFVEFTDWAKIPNSQDSLRITHYVWQKDFNGTKTDGSEYNARYALSVTPGMISGFIPYMGPFPFKTYGHTSLQPFWAGGMEHQRMTSINRTWLRGWSANGLAHEIMHQWLGDYVTCAEWGEMWLNEGGGTWGEALWQEPWGGYKEYISVMKSKRSDYLRINAGQLQPPIWGISVSNVFNYATSYAKASWMYHMLRTMLGDQQFFPALRNYLNDHAYGNATTEDIQKAFERYAPNPSVPYNVFFNQWLKKPGHPILKFSKLREDKNANGEVYIHYVIEQIQQGNSIPEVYQLPLTMMFQGVSDTVTEKIIMKSRVQEGFVQLKSSLKKAIIDPYDDILIEKDTNSGVFLSIVDQNAPETFTAFLTSFHERQALSILSPLDDIVHISIMDINGKTVFDSNAQIQDHQQLEIPLPELTKGVYFIRVYGLHHSIMIPLIQ